MCHKLGYMGFTKIRSCYLSPGRREFTHNFFINIVPCRLTLCMMESKAYTGDVKLSPFNFGHFDVSEILVNAGGLIIPACPYEMKWNAEDMQVVRPYIEMMDATMSQENTSNGITPQQYRNGWSFFVIILAPSLEDHRGFELVRNGTTTVHMKFRNEIPAGAAELICLAEFDQLLYIDQNRVVLADGTV